MELGLGRGIVDIRLQWWVAKNISGRWRLDERCFKSDQTRSEWQRGTHWRMLLIGSKGSGMFGHKDILRTSSWQAQITGYKRWHLCITSQDKYMCVSNILFLYYYASTNDFILYNIAITTGTKRGCRRVWPDYEKWPNFEKANCIDDVASPGEMIFYPKILASDRNVARRGRKPSRVGHWNSSRCQQLQSSGRVGEGMWPAWSKKNFVIK